MRLLFAFLIAAVLSAGAAPSLASDNNAGNDGGESGRTPAESWSFNYLPLEYGGGLKERISRMGIATYGRPEQQVLIEIRLVEATSVDKLDLSAIPLFGALVGPEFNGDDMTEENKIGNVFRTGNESLFIALDPAAAENSAASQVAFPRVVIFNQKLSFEIKPLEYTFTTGGTGIEGSLGELQGLGSVREATTQVIVPDGNTILLGGLRETDYGSDSKIPFLSEIPMLNRLFAGTAHRAEKNTLLILIKPSILTQEE